MNPEHLRAAWTSRALSVLRIMAGLLIIQHGMAKIIGFPAVAAFANPQPLSLLGATGFIELIGGALLILGLLTRPAAFILSGEMAMAYFMVHAPMGFYPLSLAILFCFSCLYLWFAGGGAWSLSAIMKRASNCSAVPSRAAGAWASTPHDAQLE